jgi:hypothetical protein
MPAAALRILRERLTGQIRMRVDDLIGALTEAHLALTAGGPDALNMAAGKIVHCHYLTGLAWRKHMAVSRSDTSLRARIDKALARDTGSLLKEIARLLALRPPALLIPVDEGYGIACAACGERAVTFQVKGGAVEFNSISTVHPTTRLAHGGTPAVQDCDAWCPECARVYCREHYSVEAEWSGSWHTASFATCPLGHVREFE